jgi:hypothetical protein
MAHNRGCAWRMIAEGEISKQGWCLPLESLLPLFLHLFVMIVSCEVTTSNSNHLQPDHFYQLFFKCFCEQKERHARNTKVLDIESCEFS